MKLPDPGTLVLCRTDRGPMLCKLNDLRCSWIPWPGGHTMPIEAVTAWEPVPVAGELERLRGQR